MTLPDMPMPTQTDVVDGSCTVAEREVALLLLEHGVNPSNIPVPKAGALDVFTEAGYLRVTGNVVEREYDYGFGHEIETVRVDWPDHVPAAVVTRIVEIFHG